MPGRPYWSGQLRLSLVSFAVQLFPATTPQSGIAFHLIDRRTGQRIRHLNVIGNQDDPVDDADIVKGYEYRKGKYLIVEPDEIANLRIETNGVLEIRQFVDIRELSPALFERPYFVVPGPKDSPEAFAVVRKAIEHAGKAGIGEISFAGREHLVAIAAPEKTPDLGLMAYLLRYRDELRRSHDYFLPIGKGKAPRVDKQQLALAGELIGKYSAPFRLDDFKDDYEDALRGLIDAKRKKQPLPTEEEPRRQPKVVNLMDALRNSVEQAGRGGANTKRTSNGGPRKGPVLVGANRRRRKVA
jgi:DNA end-binding protein Ku